MLLSTGRSALLRAPASWVHTRFRAMGTEARVTVLAGSDGRAASLADRAAPFLEALEARWSRFRPTSEVSRLNAAGGAPVVMSRNAFDAIARAVDAWRRTDGRYDPTVLPAVIAAGYDRDFRQLAPDRATEGRATRPAPGCAAIVLDPVVGSVTLPRGVALDLGGIGKGLAADLLAAELLASGADGVCVDLGGDVRISGASPRAGGWEVTVEDPLQTGAAGSLVVAVGGVATSTRLRRRWTRHGEPLHHLIDPRTGRPAWTGLASVTVVASDTCWAEVLAKAAFVAGAEAGARLLVDAGVTGLFVHDDGTVSELAGLRAFR